MCKTPTLVIRYGTILDPESGAERRADLLIRNGKIHRIADSIPSNSKHVYDASNLMISPGWMDMHVHLREPGYEYKETIETGCRAAAFGGFTAVACMPNTNPPIHTSDVVEFVIERARDFPVEVYPIACVSKGREGRQLAEMGQLADAGAVAFSDDGAPVQSSGLMRRALEYASMVERPVINHMEDLTLGPKGHMHEGAVSARLGVPPVPALSEEVMVARDLLIAEYTGGHLHVAHITMAKSVDMIRQAKARGINVTAETCPHHFVLTDEAVETTAFSTNVKMHPPLRTRADVAAIKEGLKDGTIDAICTDHAPHAAHEKEVEFVAAPDGIIGLETAWGLIGKHLIASGVLTVAEAVRCLTVAPRRILGLPAKSIQEGEEANLTVFDVSSHWTFGSQHIRSKSRNTPFVGAEMVGRAHAIYNRGRFVKNAP